MSERQWFLHYEFGIHHIYIKIDWDQLSLILNDLSTEFVIHQEFDDQDNLLEVWIENYYGDRYEVAYCDTIFP